MRPHNNDIHDLPEGLQYQDNHWDAALGMIKRKERLILFRRLGGGALLLLLIASTYIGVKLNFPNRADAKIIDQMAQVDLEVLRWDKDNSDKLTTKNYSTKENRAEPSPKVLAKIDLATSVVSSETGEVADQGSIVQETVALLNEPKSEEENFKTAASPTVSELASFTPNALREATAPDVKVTTQEQDLASGAAQADTQSEDGFGKSSDAFLQKSTTPFTGIDTTVPLVSSGQKQVSLENSYSENMASALRAYEENRTRMPMAPVKRTAAKTNPKSPDALFVELSYVPESEKLRLPTTDWNIQVQAGSVLKADYGSRQGAADFNPTLGVGVDINLNKKWSVLPVIEYFKIDDITALSTYETTTYDFIGTTQTSTIETEQLHFLSLPLTAAYRIGERSQLRAGGGISYLLNTNSLLAKQETTNIGGYTDLGSEQVDGYVESLAIWNPYLQAGYNYYLTELFSVGITYRYGLTDVMKSAADQKDRNSQLRIALGLNFR